MRLDTITRVWKSIEGYEGLYEVSNLGEVRSLYYGGKFGSKILKPGVNKDGYLYIGLSKNGNTKTVYIHRLVALAFVDGYKEGLVVNHIDENKQNNVWTNLEWVTSKYNCNYGTRNKRGGEARSKRIYCLELDKVFNSITEASRELGLTYSNIVSCCRSKRKTTGGFHWEYIE